MITETLHSLNETERDCMRRMIDAGLVISVGEHAKLRAVNRDLVAAIESIARALPSKEGLGGHAPIDAIAHCARAAIARAKGQS